ncbi:MAG: GNAT family N-acetyltransferase [Candidatus Kariarchaeaceae archaeon]
MSKIEKNFTFDISDKYSLRIAQSDEEFLKIGEFNELVHNEPLKDYIVRLCSEHPNKDDIYFLYIVEKSTEQILSSLGLLPLKWKIEDTDIKIAEMGFVGTLEEYRGQGLFGIINSYYEKILKQEGYLLSVLRGIPNFYRKYGYEFALPLDGGYTLPTSNIPGNPESEIKIRKAVTQDLRFIQKSYSSTFSNQCFSTVFDDKAFTFRMMNETCNTLNSMTYIVEQGKNSVGFFSIGSLKDPNQADMVMTSHLTEDQMIRVLNFIKKYNPGLVTDFTVNVWEGSDFGNFIINLGGKTIKPWGWQVQIIKLKPFFDVIKGVLEKRIQNSMFKELTRTITISDYKQIITLDFQNGIIEEITTTRAYPDRSCDLRMPRFVLTKLLLCDKTISEINYIITDAIIKKEAELLISTLFPKMNSFPYSWY